MIKKIPYYAHEETSQWEEVGLSAVNISGKGMHSEVESIQIIGENHGYLTVAYHKLVYNKNLTILNRIYEIYHRKCLELKWINYKYVIANLDIKEKLIEEGIPFVIDGKQIFLPFIGYLLSKENERELAPVHLISFLTQKMLLIAIYERWNEEKVSDAAKRMGVSTKSASRCFDELEYLNIDVLGMKGKSRVINIPDDRKQLWQQIERVLRNPVIRRFVLREDMKIEKKAGISALCEYSLLSDNVYPTYAVTKRELKASGVKVEKQVSELEEIGCVVLELGYFIDFLGKGFQEPLSVVLSLTGEEQEEERVDISINEMLEEYVWSKD